MKANLMAAVAFFAGLPACFPAAAQPMQPPMLPQAIGTHMQQQRTLEQREAIEAKSAAPAPAFDQSAPTKKRNAKKAKKAKAKPAA
ncbi:MAG: hypothetical protein OEL20_09750 [Sulfuritalea sp.]|nr:hypothetical protein [Sulfuritalea sp.]